MDETEKRSVHFEGKFIPLDEDGHLIDADDWSEGLAGHLAGVDGLSLGEEHWRVIRFIRTYHRRYDSVPMPKVIIKGLNREAGCDQFTVKRLYALFPSTPMRRACRYAGVPQPAGCT